MQLAFEFISHIHHGRVSFFIHESITSAIKRGDNIDSTLISFCSTDRLIFVDFWCVCVVIIIKCWKCSTFIKVNETKQVLRNVFYDTFNYVIWFNITIFLFLKTKKQNRINRKKFRLHFRSKQKHFTYFFFNQQWKQEKQILVNCF